MATPINVVYLEVDTADPAMAIWLIDDERNIELRIPCVPRLDEAWQGAWATLLGKSEEEAFLRHLIENVCLGLAKTVALTDAETSPIDVATDAFGNIYRLLPYGGAEVLGHKSKNGIREGAT